MMEEVIGKGYRGGGGNYCARASKIGNFIANYYTLESDSNGRL